MQRGNQQGFAKTAGTAQEQVIAVRMSHTVNIFRLVDIKETILPQNRECLRPYRVSPSYFHGKNLLHLKHPACPCKYKRFSAPLSPSIKSVNRPAWWQSGLQSADHQLF